ncbi:MAG: flagellar hook-associated protein FlgL [Gammaproteobacteria bacterium]|nr:flagellar hook-associated protein FlgL [Gammaproteobacteria bacterium]
MSVRISSAQMYSKGLSGLLDAQKAVSKTQEQISANKRVLTPGDDPIAATRILQLNQELAQISQHNQSLSTLENRLQREEVALAGISEQILTAQELITKSGNAALNAEQRGYIALELQSVVDAMAQLMNTRDASGEYIFSGHQGREQPFVKGVDGTWSYNGDEGQRHIRIASTTSVAASDSGKTVFMDVPSVDTGVVASANPGNTGIPPAVIGSAEVVDRDTFSSFYPGSVVIEFRPMNEVNPPALNYTIKQISDGRVLVGNAAYIPGEKIRFAGTSVRINGSPAVGDSFKVESSNRTGLLEGLEDYIRTLHSLTDSAQDKTTLAAQLGNALGNLGNAQTRLLETRSSVGSRLNVVEAARANNIDFEFAVKTALSEVSDLDYAKAISQMTQESFILEAAQASFARISRLSLFNYL